MGEKGKLMGFQSWNQEFYIAPVGITISVVKTEFFANFGSIRLELSFKGQWMKIGVDIDS